MAKEERGMTAAVVNPDLARRHEDAAERLRTLLYGQDPTQGIVSVERSGPSTVAIYTRQPDGTIAKSLEPFHPWLVASSPEPWQELVPDAVIAELDGDRFYRYHVQFPSWPAFTRAIGHPRTDQDQYFRQPNPVTQYLTQSGKTLFKGMTFEDVRRLQLDIETLGLDPAVPEAEIIMVALKMGAEEVLLRQQTTEADLLEALSAELARLDPDVIEGHNLYNFDLPYLATRARRAGVRLSWGRDGSELWLSDERRQFRAGPVSLPYRSAHITGRHIVDTYQQIQRFDSSGRLTSYGLKPVIAELGLTRDDREFVSGDTIADLWRQDPDRLARYALDDVRDVDVLARVTLPTEFYQSQILPLSLESAAVVGTGTKINDLMVRSYVTQGQALPRRQPSRPYPGGHAELLRTGLFGPVVKCDVESLYPSIMLAEQIHAESDSLRLFPLMLAELTQRRIDAKRQTRSTHGHERAYWDALQNSFKVLINSFYGYLGFGGGLFNDYDAATRVTVRGQELVRRVVDVLEQRGAVSIEVDTDGVYFSPPKDVDSLAAEECFVERVGAALPQGIRLAHDGRYARMLSLKLKTYALLDDEGTMVLKGSSLRSRRMERCFRRFIHDAARGFLEDRREEVRESYLGLARAIQNRELAPDDLSQWTMVNRSTLEGQQRLKRLLDANPGRWQFGERVHIYERQDEELALLDDYAYDENVRLLLRKLRDSAVRFEPLFAPHEFEAFFPAITPVTDIDLARERKPTQQLGLFG
jgi:DNA polymerase, archaea type